MQSPEVIQVSPCAVNRLAVVSGKLWACSQNRIRVINPTTSAIEVSGSREVTDLRKSYEQTLVFGNSR